MTPLEIGNVYIPVCYKRAAKNLKKTMGRSIKPAKSVLTISNGVDLVFNNFTTDKKYGAGFFKGVVRKALGELGLRGKSIGLSINLVGKSRIKALNKKYRGKNKATDVLSFPLNEKVGAKADKSGIIALGDVFICLPIAKRWAPQKGRGLNSELTLLTVHGFLHLLGYNHEKPSEERKMFSLQKRIIEKLS